MLTGRYPDRLSFENVLFPDDTQGLPQEEEKLDWSLYDLDADPGERVNLIDRNPDIVEKLKEMAVAFSSDLEAGKKPMGEYQATEGAGANE